MTRFLNRRRAGPPVVIRRSTGATGRFARLRFEELEPRILLSADLVPGLPLPGHEEVGVLPLNDSLHVHAERQVATLDTTCEAAAIADLYVVQPGEQDALERAESLARATCGTPALVVELDATRDGFEQLEEITGSLAALERMTVIVPSTPEGFTFGDANWGAEAFAARIEGVAVQCGAVIDLVASGGLEAATASQRLELVLVDARVADADSLVADLLLQSDPSVRYEVITVDSATEGLAQVGAALQGRHDVAALHVISHGADGGVLLGAGFVDAGALRGAADQVGAWSGALTADADILLYGCDVAGGERGREFAGLLASLTGADVASSDDVTSADLLGGDWQFEYQVGEVQAAVAVSKTMQQAWSGKLALDPVAVEVPVNTLTTGTQSAAGTGPGAIAMDDAGNYVVVFEDGGSNAGDVYFRRFDASGNPLGPATCVNVTLTDRQYDARVAMAGNGSFVVTWTSNLQDGSGTGIFARRFAADGTAVSGEFRVNTTTTGDQSNSTVAMAGGGAFVVGWVSDDGSGTGIRGQRYDAAGVAQGGELTVNVTTTNVQSGPSATITDAGNFGFVWQGLQSGSYDVYLRGYSSTGVPGGETLVNQTTAGAQTSVSIGLDGAGSNVVIAWASAGQDPDGSQGIYARRFNGAGVAVGNEFRVSTSTAGTQSAPAIAVDADGDFVVGWNDAGLDGSGNGVYLQRFDANGLRIGGEVRANTTTSGEQLLAGVAISGSHVAVAWEGNGTGDAAGVFTRAFTAVQYTTVTVSTTADSIDGSNTSSVAALLASRGVDGQISLREALTAANNTVGPVRILFDVPAATVGGVHTIDLSSALPAITNRVLIDGTTEPDHGTQPMIVLRAQPGFTVASGLQLVAGSGGSEIRGLVFQGFADGALAIADSDANTIAGNWIGLDSTGNAASTANGWGITLWNAANNVIGGATAADRNVISGVLWSGISITTNDGSSTGNRIVGNYLGTNAAGSAALGNRYQGVWLDAAGNFIGGTEAGERNVISGTTDWVGVELTANAANTTIQGNYIGLDATGTNVLGNSWGSIYLQSSGNVIGGSASGAGNVLAGGAGAALSIVDAAATGNVVTGNRIGTDATGTLDFGNSGDGIWIINGAFDNRIGGTAPGEANWIANHAVNGVEVSGAGGGNALLGNLFWGNASLAIDLVGDYGLTANDAADADAGPNALQNFPMLDSAIVAAGATTISGSINSTANTTLRLEFFSSATADASGHGEAAVFLGTATVTTDAGGNARFSATLFGVGVTTGHAVSATATVSLGGGNYGSTSEFAANVVAAPLQAPVVGVPGAQVALEDVARTFSTAAGNAITVTDADAASGTVEVTLAVTQGTLTLAGTGGLSFVIGDGTADATLVFRGTTAAINVALDGLVFTPPAEYSGGSTLTVTARDALVVGLERDSGLEGRYTFEGAATDVAPGTPQDGTLLGDATFTSATGHGQVLSLDGNGDAVQVAGVVGTANVTVGGWVNLSALSVGRTEFISLDDRVHIALDDYAGVKGSVQIGVGQWLDLNSNQFFAGSGWHHVMYVYDDVNDAHALYIDGQLAASATTTSSIYWSGASTTWIGRHPTNNPGWDLEGQLDDVRIYGRALSAAEVASIAGGSGLQDSDSVAITINAVGDAPVLGFASGSFTYPENAGAVVMAPFATVSDVDSPDFAGGSLVVSIAANGQAEDRIGIRHEGTGVGQVGIAGNVVSYGGVAIGTFSGGTDGSTPLVVSFNASASVAAVQAVGRNITYQNVSEAPSTLARTVTGYVTDGDGGTSNLVSGTINIQPSNDAPVVTTSFGSLSYNENAGAVAIDPGLAIVDVDSPTLAGATVRIAVAYAAGEDSLGFTNQSGITGSWDSLTGTLTLSGTATVAQYQAALRSITYTNGSENPSIAVRDVTFAVSDGVAGSNVAMRQVQVVSWGDAPTTDAVFASGSEDGGAIAITLSGADVDGSIASFSLASLPANGKLYADAGLTSLVATGNPYSAVGNSRTLYFVPDANWNGATSFQYSATDNLGMADMSPATATIAVAAANDAPTTAPVTLAPHPEDGGPRLITQADLLANAADIDGDPLLATNLQLATGAGALLDNGDGTWTFTPATNDAASVAFTYTIADGSGGSVAGNASLDLVPVNDAPTTTAVTLAAHPEDGGPRLITQAELLANAADVDGGALVAGSLQIVAGAGSLLDNGNGTWTYSPAADDDAFVAFSYTIADGNGGSVAGSASLELTPVNDAPTTTPVTLAPHAEDAGARLITQADLLANAADVEGDALLAANLQLVAGSGALLDNGDGTWSYTPAGNDDSAASFSYAISDGRGGSVAGSATLDLVAVNDAPTTTPVTLAPLAEDGGPRLITQAELLANAADIDGGGLLATNLQIATGAGSLFDNGDGTWTYTPSTNDDGAASFSYTIADGNGGSVAGSATLDLTPVNDAPTTTPVTLAPLAEDGGARLITQADLLANAADVDGDALLATNLQLATGAGVLLDNGDGTWSYTPAANDDGAASFSYTIADGNGGSVAGSAHLDLSPVNDAPTTTPVTLAPLAEDGGARLITQAELLANATDIDGGALLATNLQLATGAGSLLDNGDGTWTYTPAASDDTAATFSYAIADGNGGSVTGSASLDLIPANDAPTTTPVTLAPLAEDGGARLITQAELLANAADIDGDSLLASNLQIATGAGTLFDNGGGTWTYSPALNDATAATFSYTIADGNGGSVTGSASLDLVAINDAPTTTPVTLAPLAEDGGACLITQADLLANAADVDGGALLATNLQIATGAGTLFDNGDGTWTYTPATNDATAATFSYTIADGNGGSVTGSATLDLTPVNDAPTTTPVTLAPHAEDGGPRLITQAELLANAADVDGGALLATNPQIATGAGALLDNGDGTWTYTPATNDDGAARFIYTISDGNGGSVAGAATLDLTPVNDAPATTPVTLAPQAEDGGPRLITQSELLANAVDVDGGALLATNLQITTGAGALLDNGDGTWTYMPAANDDTATSFSYTIDDRNGGTVAGVANLDLLPVNDAPVITSDGGGANAMLARDENVAAVTRVAASDVEVDVLRYAIVGGADSALFQVDSASGALGFVTSPDFETPVDADRDGIYEVLLQVDDGHGGLSTQALRIVVGDVNEAPTPAADALDALAGQSVTIATTTLLANDADVDGDSLQLVAVSAPGFGSVAQDTAGNWVYTPAAGFAGLDRFTYTVADAAGLKATAEVSVVVLAADVGGAAPGGGVATSNSAAGPAAPATSSGSATLAGGSSAADATVVTGGSGGAPTAAGDPATGDAGAGAGTAADDGVDAGAAESSSNPAAAPTAADPGDLMPPLFDADQIFGPPVGGRPPAPGGDADGAAPSGFALDQQAAARERALETRQWAPATAMASKDGIDALLATSGQQALGLFRSLASAATSDDVGHSLRAFRDVLDDIGTQTSTANREIAEVVVGSGVVLSAGAVAWLLRAGALGASLLSVLPAWSTFDPIPVIRRRRRRRKDEPPAPADLAAEDALARVLRPGLRRATLDVS